MTSESGEQKPVFQRFEDAENEARMARGELYHAFSPRLVLARDRCRFACDRFNLAGDVPRRKLVELWKDIIDDKTPLPPQTTKPEDDEALFAGQPWVRAPIMADYGMNIIIGPGVFLNANCTFIDTCTIKIGARTLVGPNCCFYSGTHPLDPFLRDGIEGPELGKPIDIGEDCWLGGSVIILPGVTLGRGVTIGAGSVVTKDVPDLHCAAGNPARILRKIEVNYRNPTSKDALQGAEVLMTEQATKLEEKKLT